MVKLNHLGIAVKDHRASRDDVDAKHRDLSAAGIGSVHPPRKEAWGYGAELTDPDGHRARLWDERSMREKGKA